MPGAALREGLGPGWGDHRRSWSPTGSPKGLPCPGQLLPGGTEVALPRWRAWESGLGRTLLTHGPGAGSQALWASLASLAFQRVEGGKEGAFLGQGEGRAPRPSPECPSLSLSHPPPPVPGPSESWWSQPFPSWGALSKYLTVGRLQRGTWVGWTLAEPQETRERRGWVLGGQCPHSSPAALHPSPPSQLHFNPEGEWGPGDRAGGQ